MWFVIDTDRWNERGKIDILRKFVELKDSSYNAWCVAQSNPSFEVWLYFHSYRNKPNANEVNKYATFKEFVAVKIPGGFDNRTMPLDIEKALNNAKSNFESKNNQPKLYSTEVYKLAEEIVSFVKPQLDECLAKK